ncbi:MAG: response regulator transcription factor [Proteobacteria bacterium]|nr:response regulator transcription factor [Pseudomonadota bacterium]
MNAAHQPVILLVEDDEGLAQLVSRYLESLQFRVSSVSRGELVMERVAREQPDLVILDLGLPGKDGLSICRELRPQFDGLILILTARSDDLDQVLGLELGADDYVIKPVKPRVLAARIHALLRRRTATATAVPAALRFASLHIDTASHTASIDGRKLELARTEYLLLLQLASHPGTMQSREALFRRIYGRKYDGLERALDIQVSRLRRKVGTGPGGRERIKTIWGAGYLFVPDAW